MSAELPPQAGESARRGALRVLLVDDEPMLLRSITRAWPKGWHELVTVGSGEAAMETMRTTAVDILVSDIDMPGISGLQLMKLARREFPEVPRVLITGNATTERALEAINEGEIFRFLTKPFPVQHLVDVVRMLGERVALVRRDGADANRRARAQGLLEWVEQRFPGTTKLDGASGTEISIATSTLAVRLAASGWESSVRLLTPPR